MNCATTTAPFTSRCDDPTRTASPTTRRIHARDMGIGAASSAFGAASSEAPLFLSNQQ